MPQQMRSIRRKLGITIYGFDGDNGVPIHVCISTAPGWNKRIWAVLSPIDGSPMSDKKYKELARFFLLLNHWEPGNVAWFRYTPPEGLLGAELEVMNLLWSNIRHVYKSVRSRQATQGECTWLKVMGSLPADMTFSDEMPSASR